MEEVVNCVTSHINLYLEENMWPISLNVNESNIIFRSNHELIQCVCPSSGFCSVVIIGLTTMPQKTCLFLLLLPVSRAFSSGITPFSALFLMTNLKFCLVFLHPV